MVDKEITTKEARKILEAYFLKRATETAKYTAKVATFTEQRPDGVYMDDIPCWWTSGMPCEHMAKIGRNTPCPCGSGKKYKKCCLLLPDGAIQPEPQPTKFTPVYTELDQLSNSVMDLIKNDKLDEAEAVRIRLKPVNDCSL